MIQGIGASLGFVSFGRRSQAIAGVVALAVSLLAGAWMLQAPPAAPHVAEASAAASALTIDANPTGALLVDLRSRAESVSIAPEAPTEPSLASPPLATLAAILEREKVLATPAVPRASETAPLPPPRPAEFGSLANHSAVSVRPLAQQNRRTVPPTAPSDNRTFFDTFLGMLQPSGPQASTPALAYAAPESSVIDAARKITSGSLLGNDRWTAVYDISAHTVYLPNGTTLEAHSGLGDKLDDPRYVHERMRGATPPHVYDLSLRERPFHGVQALRLTPVGDGGIFGRAGLLAHTYMLGPRGDSNGCVSFRNYDAFLRAFQNGEVKRLVVVARRD
jgi:hypothetical protein